ncbi:unnamed protein product [Blepharisma stoltei]|uniref:ATP-dependent DNA helicase n=1 Tax=Blepharisma stoltei TaxID=1481888 RepID=A0AAU9IZR8_9CILI|nr:unnamed protein product [Blepharisma stoltei]
MKPSTPYSAFKKFYRPSKSNSGNNQKGDGSLAKLIKRRADASKELNPTNIKLNDSLPSLLLKPKSSEDMPPEQFNATPQKKPQLKQLPSLLVSPSRKSEIKLDIDKANQTIFSNTNFLPSQREIIESALKGNDIFVCLPTGAGKSLTFQLPAVVSEGITVVVMPLISLIHDQSVHLQKLGINSRVFNSMQSLAEQDRIFWEIEEDESIKLLFVTPEKISQSDRINNLFADLYRRKRLVRFAIDEAHCISKWGRDFRADYLKLGCLRSEYPNVPIMTLTASATEMIRKDIITLLGMKNPQLFLSSFNRHNLFYGVFKKGTNVNEEIAHFIKENHPNSSGLIYCLSKEECSHLAKVLKRTYKFKVEAYHSDIDASQKTEIHEKWKRGDLQIIVATVAFGMGIDKADVRFVIHCSFPKSLDSYYQETGRAGRDGNPADCILYYAANDKSRHGFLIGSNFQGSTQKDYNELSKMIDYCENRLACRRTLLLGYFGEDFQAENCNNMCDNCKAKRFGEEKDFTEEAKKIIEVLEGPRNGINTLIQLTNFLLGKKEKTNNHSLMEHFGLLQKQNPDTISKILKKMLLEGVLQEKAVSSAYTGTFAYIETGSNVLKLRRNQIKIAISVEIKGLELAKKLKNDVKIENKTEEIKIPVNNEEDEESRKYGKCQQKETFEEIKSRLTMTLKRLSKQQGVGPDEIISEQSLDRLCRDLPENCGNYPAEISQEIKHFKKINGIEQRYEFEIDLEAVDFESVELKRKPAIDDSGIKRIKPNC